MENSNWQFVLLFGHENLVLITIHPRLAAKKVICYCVLQIWWPECSVVSSCQSNTVKSSKVVGKSKSTAKLRQVYLIMKNTRILDLGN